MQICSNISHVLVIHAKQYTVVSDLVYLSNLRLFKLMIVRLQVREARICLLNHMGKWTGRHSVVHSVAYH